MNNLKVLFSLSLFLFMTIGVQAQHNHSGHSHSDEAPHSKKSTVRAMTDIFIVNGNCSMCENRIEGALFKVDGITSADWNVDNKVMTVVYDDDIITLDEIKSRIAKVGHDTGKFIASDEVYNNLPSCCQYERPNN